MKSTIIYNLNCVAALHGKDTNATTEVDRLANKFISTFNLNKGKIKGAQANAFAIDNSSQNSYNNEAGGTANEQTKRNQNNKNTSTGAETGANDGGNSGRRGISFFNDLQGTRRIFEISRNAETVQSVKYFASMVYALCYSFLYNKYDKNTPYSVFFVDIKQSFVLK